MTNRQPAGIRTGGQFATDKRAPANIQLALHPDAAIPPDTPGGTPEGRFRHLMTVEPGIDEALLREVFAPEKVAANAGRFYDYLRDNGIGADSATREAAFAYAASALDRPYDDFYDAWMEERPVDLGTAGTRADESGAGEHAPDRDLTELTGREHKTLRAMPLTQLLAVTDKLKQGPAPGFRATGPNERAMILAQIGDSPIGNVAAISGGRAVPLPDGVELPVSHGVKVRVRLAGNDTYTVQRVRARAGEETLLGQREGVYADSLPEVAYRAGMYKSYRDPEEW